MKALAIIPARYQSSRFPGKPLAQIGGKAMLLHVYDNVKASGLFQKTVIATDDDRISQAAQNWNAECVSTSDRHISGTDRCAEVLEKMDDEYDIVVNVQGDEPFIHSKPLALLLSVFDQIPDACIATMVQKIDHADDIWDANTAKVVLSSSASSVSRAMYFSRSPIPFIRSVEREDWANFHIFWKHIGLYAFRPQILKELVALPQSLLEKAESLEQLRWLESGYPVYVAETDYKTLSVDTPEDLAKAENFYKKNVRV